MDNPNIFAELSYAELKHARTQIDIQMQARRDDALEAFKKTAADLDMSPVMDAANGRTPKYRGPNGEEWAGGRGRKPEWVAAIIEAGGDVEQYRCDTISKL